MKRVRVTRHAERDLDEIWLHIARDNADAANHFVDELAARFVLIGSSPEMGRSRDELKPGVRSHPVGNYVIYYRVTRAYISILHVIHGARDPKRAFHS
jgi:toxin ParE1/3/4